MAEAPSRADARKALERFRGEFDAKYPKAVAKLDKDWDALTAFYDFPAEHWRHLRTTNPIESSFATVKLRTKVTKGAGSKKAALAMAYKLLDAAQERWRRFNGHELVADVLDGVKFKDGIKVTDDETTTRTRRSPPDDSSPASSTTFDNCSSYDIGSGYGHIAITASDLDGTLARLAEQGIQPEKPPYTVREGGSRLCFVRDPDGYRVEILKV